MESTKKSSEPLDNFSSEEIENLVRTNDALDEEQARILKEEELKVKQLSKRESSKKLIRRLRKSPLEVINRSLFFIFIGSFLFSFISVYSINTWWFIIYILSAFSCILYTPNRQALKELIAAWPNIEDILKNRSQWK